MTLELDEVMGSLTFTVRNSESQLAVQSAMALSRGALLGYMWAGKISEGTRAALVSDLTLLANQRLAEISGVETV